MCGTRQFNKRASLHGAGGTYEADEPYSNGYFGCQDDFTNLEIVQPSSDIISTPVLSHSSLVDIADLPEMEQKTQKKKKKYQRLTPGLTAKGGQRQFIQHQYKDRAAEEDTYQKNEQSIMEKYDMFSHISDKSEKGSGKPTPPFPLKLYMVLSDVQRHGLDNIVSWQPHGRAFLIHDPKAFASIVVPRYFRQSKITSFNRQLNLYGFNRITHGYDNGSYYHEFFLRGRPALARKIFRTKIKGTKIRAATNPEKEPNLSNWPRMPELEIKPLQDAVVRRKQPIMSSTPPTVCTPDDVASMGLQRHQVEARNNEFTCRMSMHPSSFNGNNFPLTPMNEQSSICVSDDSSRAMERVSSMYSAPSVTSMPNRQNSVWKTEAYPDNNTSHCTYDRQCPPQVQQVHFSSSQQSTDPVLDDLVHNIPTLSGASNTSAQEHDPISDLISYYNSHLRPVEVPSAILFEETNIFDDDIDDLFEFL